MSDPRNLPTAELFAWASASYANAEDAIPELRRRFAVLAQEKADAEKERDEADAPGTPGGRMRVLWDWIHEDGAGREAVLERLCPGWSIISSKITSEKALMVAFDALVAAERDRDRLREALREIVDGPPINYPPRFDGWGAGMVGVRVYEKVNAWYSDIARAALSDGGTDA